MRTRANDSHRHLGPRLAMRASAVLATALLMLLAAGVASAGAAEIIALKGRVAERYRPGSGWAAQPLGIGDPVGVAYDPRHAGYVYSIANSTGSCSFAEVVAGRVIAEMNAARFRHATGSSLMTSCALHENPAGGVLISASAGTLGSLMSWSVNVVSDQATYLGYGYGATTNGRQVALIQHTYFGAPEYGTSELLAAGPLGHPHALTTIVAHTEQDSYGEPALSPAGRRLAVIRSSRAGGGAPMLLVGTLGGRLQTVTQLPERDDVADLQWFGAQLVALIGVDGARSGTLALIDPVSGRRSTLATGVSAFAARS